MPPMNVVLWAVQILLALVIIGSGITKTFQPIDTLVSQTPLMVWALEVPSIIVRISGIAEILGVAGLLLPLLRAVPPKLTPLAGLGLMILMVAALVFHLSRGEANLIGFPLVLLIVATFVTVGRWKISPIKSK